MSLNKSLDRFFDEIRREARRNPAFADRLDAVMRAHASRRDVVDEAVVEEEPAEAAKLEPKIEAKEEPKKEAKKPPRPAPVAALAQDAAAITINPVGLIQREGEDALELALIDIDRTSLLALVAEHNLDPAGEAGALDHDALVAHVVAYAKKRAERDKKLFDY